MKNSIFCPGELLIDMVCTDGKGLKDGENFQKKAGGAPANVAAAISKLEGSAYFLGQVGSDYFGRFLLEMLENLKIDISMAVREGNTTIALVGIDGSGERNFEFLRGSDGQYSIDNIDTKKIKDSDIIHFGSATGFLPGELRNTYFKLLNYAEANNIFVSFDPNYRDALIEDSKLDQYIEDYKYFIKHSDFVKLSDEELYLITKEKDIEKGVSRLHEEGARIVTITLGAKGTYLSVNGKGTVVESIKIKQIDSTGAGDAYVGAVLQKISQADDKKNITFDEWIKIVKFANKVGALTCTNYGAISSIPTLKQINEMND